MAIRNDFAPGETLLAADLNDTFGSKAPIASPTFTGTVTIPGVNLGDWVTFTPVWTAGAGAAIGNGSMTGQYARLGDVVIARYRMVYGSTTNFGAAANWSWNLPQTAVRADGTIGHAFLFDTSLAAVNQAQAVLLTATTFWLNITATGTFAVSNTNPWTWADGDSITINVVYEGA
jgi:hypothetical protein